MNRFANYSPSVNLEIESSILRGLVPSGPGEPPAPAPRVVEAPVAVPAASSRTIAEPLESFQDY
jgi:hypothetical protein